MICNEPQQSGRVLDFSAVNSRVLPLNPQPEVRDEAALKQVAQEFEAVFLSEMLKYSGLNATPEGFGGGAGEDAYSGLLTQEYARAIVEKGGIGVAEQVFEILKQRNSEQ